MFTQEQRFDASGDICTGSFMSRVVAAERELGVDIIRLRPDISGTEWLRLMTSAREARRLANFAALEIQEPESFPMRAAIQLELEAE